MTDLISREKTIHELRNALYKYEDENEEKHVKNNNTDEWFLHIRPAVQDMNDIDVQTIVELPSESPWHTGTPTEEGWYLIKYKHQSGIRYIAMENPSAWVFSDNSTIAWQKIEE